MGTNCERDLMSLVKLIKEVFNIECWYEYYHPLNFYTSFHYKCYEVNIYTCVDLYRETYENEGHVIITIKDERFYKEKIINNISFDACSFSLLYRLYENKSINMKFHKNNYLEYLKLCKKYMDEDKIYTIMADYDKKERYIIEKGVKRKLDKYSYNFDEPINFFGEENGKRVKELGLTFE